MTGHSLLVLGGARSGKSRYAQARAGSFTGERVFLATAQAFDDEMRDRIARHREERGSAWTTIEEPLALADAIVGASRGDRVVLVDCLTLWTSNLLLGGVDVEAHTRMLVAAIVAAPGPIILVANEVGWGIVPDNALARRFRDAAGKLNQAVAEAVDEVQLVVAGLPLRLK